MYYSQVNDVLFNLLDSHDTNRLLDKAQQPGLPQMHAMG